MPNDPPGTEEGTPKSEETSRCSSERCAQYFFPIKVTHSEKRNHRSAAKLIFTFTLIHRFRDLLVRARCRWKCGLPECSGDRRSIARNARSVMMLRRVWRRVHAAQAFYTL